MSFLSHTHTCVSSVRTDGVATSFGKLKRVEQKVPGFMLIFIKIILTCNVAAGSVHRTTQDEGKKDEGLRAEYTGLSGIQAGDKFFSVLASLSGKSERVCLCMLVHVHASANPAGHLKYLNAQNNKLAIFQKLNSTQNFCTTRFSLTFFWG